jgi:hypothetical protein
MPDTYAVAYDLNYYNDENVLVTEHLIDYPFGTLEDAFALEPKIRNHEFTQPNITITNVRTINTQTLEVITQ